MKIDNKGAPGVFRLLKKAAALVQTQSKGAIDKEDFSVSTTNNDQAYLPKVGKRHQITGLRYRMENVMALAKANPNYKLDKAAIIKKGLTDTYIHKYLFTNEPVELVQEPGNPHDPNAIMVVVAGKHIGYIKAGSCAHLNKVINEGRVDKVLCRISGGPYKAVFRDVSEATGQMILAMNSGSDDIRAEIRVIERPAKK